MSHPYLQALVAAAQVLGPIRVAIAYLCDAASLGAAIEAASAGLILSLLVGPEVRVRVLAKAHALDLSACECTSRPMTPKRRRWRARRVCAAAPARATRL